MDHLLFVYSIGLIITLGIIAWTYTPKGKKWLKDL